jgi:hypothetical protein
LVERFFGRFSPGSLKHLYSSTKTIIKKEWHTVTVIVDAAVSENVNLVFERYPLK